MNKVVQKNNTVDGDQVAGDKYEHNVHVHDSSPGLLKTLQKQFEEDCKSQPDLKEFIEIIQHYLDRIDDTEVEGLESKLQKAHRNDELKEAEKCKEKFVKLLTRNQFSEAAQKMYTHLLGRVHENFKGHVRPLIQEGASRKDIDKALLKEVIEPLLKLIDDNLLHIHPPELRGMLYFLTGNCHIQWHANADVS